MLLGLSRSSYFVQTVIPCTLCLQKRGHCSHFLMWIADPQQRGQYCHQSLSSQENEAKCLSFPVINQKHWHEKMRICGSYLHYHRQEHKPSVLNGLADVGLADYDKMVIKASESTKSIIASKHTHMILFFFLLIKCNGKIKKRPCSERGS